jgi:hypothetical protein
MNKKTLNGWVSDEGPLFDESDFNESCNGAGDHPNCVKCPRYMDGLGCVPDEKEQSEFALKKDGEK